MKINIFWFRRDLRMDDNIALNHALAEGIPVMVLFIFNTVIIDELPADDPRIGFIYETLSGINNQLLKSCSSLLVLKGDPETLWRNLVETYDLNAVFINKDYEPYSISRDLKVESILRQKSVSLYRFKDCDRKFQVKI
jgi:deoxyribodipyrimidine photo-lyase